MTLGYLTNYFCWPCSWQTVSTPKQRKDEDSGISCHLLLAHLKKERPTAQDSLELGGHVFVTVNVRSNSYRIVMAVCTRSQEVRGHINLLTAPILSMFEWNVNKCAPFDDDNWWFVYLQLCTCWCTMSFSSCSCGPTGKPSSPSPWTPWRRWVCPATLQHYCGLGRWGMAASADVGYSLAMWSSIAAFRLIILPSGRVCCCTVMALMHSRLKATHTHTHARLHFRANARGKATSARLVKLWWSRRAGSNHSCETYQWCDRWIVWGSGVVIKVKFHVCCAVLLSSELFVSSVQS